MAAKFGFLKIGEANAEIEKLTKERDDLKARAELAESNLEEVTNQAEQARKDSNGSAAIQKQLEDEKIAHAATKASITAKDSEITTLKAAQTDFDVKVEKAASAKALQITASLGVPPVTIAPVVDPAAPPKSEKIGFARTQELIEMEISNRK